MGGNRTKEQQSAQNVMSGRDMLSTYVASEARAQPSVAAHAVKMMQIQRQVMWADMQPQELGESSHDIATPDEEQPLMEHLLGSEDADEEQQEIQLGLMGLVQRAFLVRLLIEMGFDRNVVEALMEHSHTPIENADQAIEIMFNP